MWRTGGASKERGHFAKDPNHQIISKSFEHLSHPTNNHKLQRWKSFLFTSDKGVECHDAHFKSHPRSLRSSLKKLVRSASSFKSIFKSRKLRFKSDLLNSNSTKENLDNRLKVLGNANFSPNSPDIRFIQTSLATTPEDLPVSPTNYLLGQQKYYSYTRLASPNKEESKCHLMIIQDDYRFGRDKSVERLNELFKKYESLKASDDLTLDSKPTNPLILPNVPPDLRIHATRLLGKGSYSSCYLAQIKTSNEQCQLKCSRLDDTSDGINCALKVISQLIYESKREMINSEISIQRRLSHPNILQFYLAFFDPMNKNLCLLLEYCPLGSLADLVQRHPSIIHSTTSPLCKSSHSMFTIRPDNHQELWKYSDQEWNLYDSQTGGLHIQIVAYIFQGLVRALSYLHRNLSIIHRDVKPANILLADELQPKLCDFGLACHVNQGSKDKSHISGTVNYLAPEIFLKSGYTFSTDMWAAGVTLYYMLYGRVPFFISQQLKRLNLTKSVSRESQLFNSIKFAESCDEIRNLCKAILWGSYELPQSSCPLARRLVCKLLDRIPDKRPTSDQVLDDLFCKLARPPNDHFMNNNQFDYDQQMIRSNYQRSRCTSEGEEFEQIYQRTSSVEANLCPTPNSVQTDKRFQTSDFCRITINENTPTSTELSDVGLDHEFAGSLPVVQTGEQFIYDAFKLLSQRATTKSSYELYWVSRWAVTDVPVLYYTIERLCLMNHLCAPNKTKSPTAPSQYVIKHSQVGWGATDSWARGLIEYENEKMIEFQDESTVRPDLGNKIGTGPEPAHLRTHCKFLVQHLQRFRPKIDLGNLVQTSKSNQEKEPIFVQRWASYESDMIFLFSTGSWQVNFHEHTKIVIRYPQGFVYVRGCFVQQSQDRDDEFKEYVCEDSFEKLENRFQEWVSNHPELRNSLTHLLFIIL